MIENKEILLVVIACLALWALIMYGIVTLLLNQTSYRCKFCNSEQILTIPHYHEGRRYREIRCDQCGESRVL